ncbi:MAG: cysteine--tRNA ligase, partial [Candidatus Omnitrophica bacterium]|nr:cysteine--tRNA ligase [Candidatus Omnitrophota bacterium]
FVKTAEYAVAELSTILGLSLTKLQLPNADYEIESKILERNEARKEGNFALADKMRKELEVKGVILEDTKDGNTFWRKKL